MTKIQSLTLLPILSGTDILAGAKTGSGKTLAFLIPTIEYLTSIGFKNKHGTGILIVTPTRELAMQIFAVCEKLIEFHNLSLGIAIGGMNRNVEADNLRKGCNILVGTPGRLLDHLKNSKDFVIKNLKVLIFDEADRILDSGFEDDLKRIINLLPKDRQTLLFSATQSKKVEDLAKLSLKNQPLFINAVEEDESATNAELDQKYVICKSEKRLLLLFSLLKKMKDKKIIVFFSTCNSVKFHFELFNFIDFNVHGLHGNMKQSKRTATFNEFLKKKSGALFSTDVCARGLDFPNIDYIIQYDPPNDPREYIHRVGRTARAGAVGESLLFLLPSESEFVKYLKEVKVCIKEYEINKIKDISEKLYKLIENNYYLRSSAVEALKSYLQAYGSHHLKHIFNANMIDVRGSANSFGMQEIPAIDISICSTGRSDKKIKKRRMNVGGGV